jgi:hypothetical protein
VARRLCHDGCRAYGSNKSNCRATTGILNEACIKQILPGLVNPETRSIAVRVREVNQLELLKSRKITFMNLYLCSVVRGSFIIPIE